MIEAVAQRCSVKNVFLEISQNSQEDTCARVSFLKNFIKKESLAQVFSYEFCEISKNTFFYRTPPVAASEMKQISYNSYPSLVFMIRRTFCSFLAPK